MNETFDQLDHVLDSIEVTGGTFANRLWLRERLGLLSLQLDKELRLIGLGCADVSLVERIRAAAHNRLAA